METNVTVGSLLSTSLAIFLKRLPQLAVLAGLIYLPYMIWLYKISSQPDQAYLALLSMPMMILGSFVVQGAITMSTYHDLRGQGFRLGAGLARAMSKILLVLGLSIATGAMVFLGSMLLIVPGIMLQCALFVAVPALMVEGLSIGSAIQRSFDLTAGYRLKIFGLFLLVGLVVTLPVAIISVVIGVMMGAETPAYQMVNAFLSGLGGCAGSVAAVVTYYRLREDVDGVGLEQLEDVFA